ncbi:hypothetical protein [Streptomyces sp. NPDC002078]
MAKDFKKLRAETRSTQRVAIPQIDPGEPKAPVPSRREVPKPAPAPKSVEKKQAEPVAVPVDPRTQPVPKGDQLMKAGWHVYQTRHRQVMYEAFMLDIKPWEVIERALDEYFKRHHGKK